MKCQKCGHENDRNASFCEMCGSELVRVNEKRSAGADNPYIDKARNLLLLGFLGLDIIASLILEILRLPNLFVYAASSVMYAACIVLSICSLRWIMKNGKGETVRGAMIATLSVGITSAIILAMNITSVIKFITV